VLLAAASNKSVMEKSRKLFSNFYFYNVTFHVMLCKTQRKQPTCQMRTEAKTLQHYRLGVNSFLSKTLKTNQKLH